MLDLKTLKSTLEQIEHERKIPKEKLIEAIELALASAYKKDFGKKGQIIRAHFNLTSGEMEFEQVKVVVDRTSVRPMLTAEELAAMKEASPAKMMTNETEKQHEDNDPRPRFNPEQHIYIEDARKIKTDARLDDEIIFNLEPEADFGRIAAQTAKQVIVQRLREAERESILEEFSGRENEVLTGIVQRVERGNIYVDFNRAIGVLPREEQIPGEYWRTGRRIKCFLYKVDDGPRGLSLRLSRSHPRFVEALFAQESPEVATGTVEIKSIAREPGSRTKIAVTSSDPNIDPQGACIGQKGIRVTTVSAEINNEKIDIIPFSEDPSTFIAKALSPAEVFDVSLDVENHVAYVEVPNDKSSLAIGKGGQKVRLAAKLTGWKIDIKGVDVDGMIGADISGDETLAIESEAAVAPEVTEAPTEESPAEVAA